MKDEGIEDIERLTSLCALHVAKVNYTTVAFRGLLVPTQSYVNAYGQAALSVTGRVWEDPRDKNPNTAYRFHGAFSSVDDSGLTFFGPHEGKEAATKRYDAFEAFIRETHPHMPTLEAIEAWGKHSGVYADFW